MRLDVLVLCLVAGGLTYAWRFLPILWDLGRLDKPWVTRFLAATGPAAIGTLFVASALPLVAAGPAELLRAGLGTLTVVLVWVWRRSVVAATLAGAMVAGLTAALV